MNQENAGKVNVCRKYDVDKAFMSVKVNLSMNQVAFDPKVKAQTILEISKVETQYIVYSKRWAILFLFMMYSASNGYMWTDLVILCNIIEKYYNVSTLTVIWTSMVYMITYIPLIFPAT